MCFVGAGPGAADLLTVRAVERLRDADVIVHDALVPARLLDDVNPHAERVPVERCRDQGLDPGSATGRLLVRLAMEGRNVVRVKGGDPTVFGRLAEELEPVRQAGLAVEFVPGVTAAVAAAAAAGVPLTSRADASIVSILTGREADDKDSVVDFARLAKLQGTLVVYMAVEQVARWSAGLLAAGKDPETPVTIVSRCSWPDERIGATTLGTCAADVERGGWRSPAVVIVGASAPPSGPLAGRLVVVTRPAGQEGDLVAAIRAAGGQTLHVPLVAIGEPPAWRPLDEAIRAASTYDWIVFASANGVRAFGARLAALRLDGRILGTARLAAIGPATRRQLELAGYRCDLTPAVARSEDLAAELAAGSRRGRFLLIRASRGREELRLGLEALGHHVDEVVAYESRSRSALDADEAEAVVRLPVDWIVLTSPSIATAAVQLFGERMRHWRIASISPVTTAALEPHGLRPAVEADRATAAGIVEAICRHDRGAAGVLPPAGSPMAAHLPPTSRG
ncbi:MAG: uroporphyrinogen-III C-methyltransferase [Planctomycetota bacterium]